MSTVSKPIAIQDAWKSGGSGVWCRVICPQSGRFKQFALSAEQLIDGVSKPCECTERCTAAGTRYVFAGLMSQGLTVEAQAADVPAEADEPYELPFTD